jgi:hypothetical protein
MFVPHPQGNQGKQAQHDIACSFGGIFLKTIANVNATQSSLI